MNPVLQTKLGMTDLAWQIAREETASSGCKSVSEWIEWVVLCQRFSGAEAASLLRLRNQRGGRGGVVVVPDGVELPPEG